MRDNFWAKSFENRAQWFIDKVRESTYDDKNSLKFIIEGGLQICSSCFRKIYSINKNFYYKYLTFARLGKSSPALKQRRKSSNATENAVLWLHQYAYYHADRMPDAPVLMLPYKSRKSDIYNTYLQDKNEHFEASVSRSQFFNIWKQQFKSLKIKQVIFSSFSL